MLTNGNNSCYSHAYTWAPQLLTITRPWQSANQFIDQDWTITEQNHFYITHTQQAHAAWFTMASLLTLIVWVGLTMKITSGQGKMLNS